MQLGDDQCHSWLCGPSGRNNIKEHTSKIQLSKNVAADYNCDLSCVYCYSQLNVAEFALPTDNYDNYSLPCNCAYHHSKAWNTDNTAYQTTQVATNVSSLEAFCCMTETVTVK